MDSKQPDSLTQPHMYPAGRTWTATIEVMFLDTDFDRAAALARRIAGDLALDEGWPVHLRSLRNSDPIEKVIEASPGRGRKVAKADRADETLRHQS